MHKKRSKTFRIPSLVAVLLPIYACLTVIFIILIRRGNMQLLRPAGYVARIQSHLLWGVIAAAAIIGSLMISAFFFVVLRYRESGRARYEPHWTESRKVQILAWFLPFAAICVFSTLLWNTAHLVDPYRPINGGASPLNIQVVALRWKWLFIYPDNRIATVNTLEIPVNTPVAFQLTADAPMNSFWIPRLSGQAYAMTGMVTQLHIMADQIGTFAGSPAEISGDDFAGMTFDVKIVSASEFSTWANTLRTKTASTLDYAAYTKLAQPSGYNPPAYYSLPDPNLFQAIVMQFMEPGANSAILPYDKG